VFEFLGKGDVVRMRGGGILGIVVGQVVVVGGDVRGGDWVGNVDAICLLLEGVVFVVVLVLG